MANDDQSRAGVASGILAGVLLIALTLMALGSFGSPPADLGSVAIDVAAPELPALPETPAASRWHSI